MPGSITGRRRAAAVGVTGTLILCAIGAATPAESADVPGAATACGAPIKCAATAPTVSLSRLLWGDAMPGAGDSASRSLLGSDPSRGLGLGAGDRDLYRYDVLLPRPTKRLPVSERYDAQDRLYVDMSYWRTTSTTLRMVYGHRAASGWPAVRAEPGKEQVGIDLDLDLGSAKFHATSGRLVGAAGPVAEDAGQALVQYRLTSGHGKLRYGAQYAQAGSEYEDYLSLSDSPFEKQHETTTLWTQVALSDRLSLRALTEQRSNRPAEDAARPRYVDELTGLKLNFVLKSWPYVGTSVWYREGVRDMAGTPARGEDITRSGASLSLRTGWGTQSLTSSLSTVGGGWLSTPANEQLSQSLNLKFNPGRHVSLGATFSVGESSKHGEDGPWAASYSSEAVWATFDPRGRNYSLTWSGNHNGYSTQDGSADYARAYTKLTLAFDSISLFEVRVPLEVTLRLSGYANDGFPHTNTSDTAVWLRFGRRPPGPSQLDPDQFALAAFDLPR
jgi:hypothetical protein